MKNFSLLLMMLTSKINATGWLAYIGVVFGIIISVVFQTNTLAIVFVVLLITDMITGIIASLSKGEKIQSRRIRDMWYKWVIYLAILITAAMLNLATGAIWIHGAALGWIALSEGVSILENCETVLGKKIPFLKRIKKMLDALKGSNVSPDTVLPEVVQEDLVNEFKINITDAVELENHTDDVVE